VPRARNLQYFKSIYEQLAPRQYPQAILHPCGLQKEFLTSTSLSNVGFVTKETKTLHHVFSGRVTMATTITYSCPHDGHNLRVMNPRMDGTTVWVHNIIHDYKICTVEVSRTYRFSVAMEIRYCHVSLRWCKPVTQLSLNNAHQKLTPKAATVVSICQSYIPDHE